MLAQKTQNMEAKSVSEEKTLSSNEKEDRRAIWIVICWLGLLLGFILLYGFTR